MKRFSLLASLLVLGFLVLACPSTPDGTDLFRVAVSGSPGALLSVWGDRAAGTHAFIAGGFVGVDHALITDGVVGRLVEYNPGSFTTVCTTDEVLWWVHSAGGAVYAAGENARVIRYQGGRCETLAVDADVAPGRPTFFGLYAIADDDVWLVGGTTGSGAVQGLVVHYDGHTFQRELALPVQATQQSLFKIDRGRDGSLVVVGDGGLIMVRDPIDGTWSRVDPGPLPGDDTLFTTSCDLTGHSPGFDGGVVSTCYAVGGRGVGLVTDNRDGPWRARTQIGTTPLVGLPALNGVFVQDAANVFIVGVDGFTMHTNGSVMFRPMTAPTSATLHGVGGTSQVVLAVGGELSVATADQRGVILVRGDDAAQFTFDGQVFRASGMLRRSLGGTGQ